MRVKERVVDLASQILLVRHTLPRLDKVVDHDHSTCPPKRHSIGVAIRCQRRLDPTIVTTLRAHPQYEATVILRFSVTAVQTVPPFCRPSQVLRMDELGHDRADNFVGRPT